MIGKYKVKPLMTNNGTVAKEQYVIHADGKEIFQSYDTIICIIENGAVTLDKNLWNYSTTTSKYRNKFLGETTKDTQKKINSGEYKLADIN
jgi:hypothetical protein